MSLEHDQLCALERADDNLSEMKYILALKLMIKQAYNIVSHNPAPFFMLCLPFNMDQVKPNAWRC